MKLRLWTIVLLLVLAGCARTTPTPEPTQTPLPSATPTLPPPAVRVTSAPDPEAIARAFFDAWNRDSYQAMYGMLTAESQQQFNEEDFIARYLDVMIQAALPTGAVEYEITNSTVQIPQAHIDFQISLFSALFGEIVRQHGMELHLQNGSWKIRWDPSLIFPDLAAGGTLRRVPLLPARGDIYDWDGDPIVAQSDAYSIGIIPAQIPPNNEEQMLNLLGRVTGLAPEYIYLFYEPYGNQADFYIPFTDVQAEYLNPYFEALTSFDAVVVNAFTSRYYFDAGLAPQTIGYVSAVQPEEVESFSRNGYWWTSRVPRAGVELWAEDALAGRRGGQLFLDSPAGNTSVLLAETPFGPSQDVYVTIDRQLQRAAQDALRGFRGAIVVMERDTGRIRAMASAPNFDPNLFEPENYNTLWDTPLDDASEPLFNRAARGQYPLGSVFKIITLATALESGLFSVEDTYDCQYEFTELQGITLYDWTLEHEDPPSGLLTLPEGLMRSCNPWFYHIGNRFFQEGIPQAIPDMALGFGLGSPTGIVGLDQEEPGRVPEPPGEALEATNIAIGQGNVEVTPLQVARFVAAVGNGGTLYQPQLIEKIVDIEGKQVYQFEPQVSGTLPISAENLAIIQDAMRQVVFSSRGTAYHVLGAFPHELAGKTGTAQVGGGLDPHAWFVAYSDEGLEDLPDIVVVAVLENAGEGGDIAAPVVRRVLENYFFGRTRSLYPWEVLVGVWEDWVDTGEQEDESEE